MAGAAALEGGGECGGCVQVAVDGDRAVGRGVTVTIRGSEGRIERLTTKRFDQGVRQPRLAQLAAAVSSAAVRSTTPEELTGVIAKHAADSGPVWIIGSGKTAMDVALMSGANALGAS